MIAKMIIFIFLFQARFEMEYDEEFTSGLKYYNNQQHQTIKKRTFKLIKKNDDYYEIINKNSIITIYCETTQIAKLENDKENCYYFKYQTNLNYYIYFEFPDYVSDFYAFYVSTRDQPLNLITSSSLTLAYAKKRELSLIIKNSDSTPKLISFRLYMDKTGQVESFLAEEDGDSFIPYLNRYDTHIYSEHHDTYYAVIKDELLFKLVIYYPYTQIYEYHSSTISLVGDVKIISENITNCISTSTYSNLIFYQLNPPSDKPYYEISFKPDSEIYNIKDNFYRIQISKINQYTINNYKFFMVNTTNNDCCFSVFFSDEKNIISEESSFNLSLFDTRNYQATFINTKDYIQIKFSKNNYFNLSLFLPNLGIIIDYKYFNPTTNEYFYIFKKVHYETLVEFRFVKIGNVKNYYNAIITYSSLDEDIKQEYIEKDTFICCNSATFFNISYKPDKKYIYLLSNDTSNTYINFVELSKINKYNHYNFHILEEKTEIEIFPSGKKICFELIYEINHEKFTISNIQKRNFTIISNNTFIFSLNNLILHKRYYIEIVSEKNNIVFTYYALTGEVKQNFKNLIIFWATLNPMYLELPIVIKDKEKIDYLHFHFYYFEMIFEDTFQCLDKILYYNLTMNSEKKYIYLVANDTENTYINNIKLKDDLGINNFYNLNEEKRLDIYASEKNVICFGLIYEIKKGIFEINGIQRKNFIILLYNNYFEFHLINLIKDITYHFEIENKNDNLNFDYYKIDDKKYDFTNNISFVAESENLGLELPV